MYLFGSFCDYDLSNRKKSSISAKKTICRVVREKVFGLPKVNRWKKNRPDFFLKPYRRFVVVVLLTFFCGGGYVAPCFFPLLTMGIRPA